MAALAPPAPDPGLHRARPAPVLACADSRATPWPLHDTAAARALEAAAAATLPPHALMRRAGQAVARLARAVMPHTRHVWIVAGPGNNGGDGFEAAAQLQQALGAHCRISVSFVGQEDRLPADASASLARARAAGVDITPGATCPPGFNGAEGLVIDALLGRGLSRPPEGALAHAIAAIHHCGAPVLAVDLPSGLPADTGHLAGTASIRARWTLALLSLPPGLFTAQGRDASGDIWWDDLGVDAALAGPGTTAWLASGPAVAQGLGVRQHAQHKGSFGDLWVVGGAATMAGAAVLAGRAALGAGAGRVYLAGLDHGRLAQDLVHPELMSADITALLAAPARLRQGTVVAGCGGGTAIAAALPVLLGAAGHLVLDADALNAAAADPALLTALRERSTRGAGTVLTPHPLEAARLLCTDTRDVQADRLGAASALAERMQAVVVLKGSGTVVVAPGVAPWIHPVGNAALATPGSGDVLAGWLGGLWSQCTEPGHDAGAPALAPGSPLRPLAAAWRAARLAVWQHGRAAERRHPDGQALPASALIEALQAGGR